MLSLSESVGSDASVERRCARLDGPDAPYFSVLFVGSVASFLKSVASVLLRLP